MGIFLSLTGVIGKTQNEVSNGLAAYAASKDGGLEKKVLRPDDSHCCVIEEAAGNTTVLYPDAYLEWDESSRFLSQELKASVFSFHIHDGDWWSYFLFADGEVVDRFNPVPDYWEDLAEEEMDAWKGDAAVVANHSGIVKADVENYLVRWNPETTETKAYPGDEFEQTDWQLLDFMKKLRLPYPLDEQGRPTGQTYKLWTNELPAAP